jgi:coenzyme F420-reducing hydrogenase delta subunit
MEEGFDGVFIAADGTDCAFVPDCTARTGKVLARAQALLKEHDHNPRRVKMAAICSVCAEAFVKHMRSFGRELAQMNREERTHVLTG